ncbi:S-layer homology domain-containing protein, partial [Flavonifractor sp. An112]|uniref:S-layer homology domain-containing protein n=1 Tax=Flavonifractor sp. An112 TaxID=1965544 RepID=UPI001179A3D8
SLALAAVMLMGMMVVGAGAASKDFTDASEIKNVEAVDVMVALGILEGGDKGDFQPNTILTREQAAKIITYMLLGSDAAEKLTTNSAVFKDVAADRWSAPYIGYCVNLGILAGDGNGNFFPEGKLTGAAFAKMLLVALGYDAKIEKYVDNEWVINVATDAIAAGIVPSGLVLTDNLSRQDAAQMAFQALTADMVYYTSKGTTVIGSDGMQVIMGASAPTKVAHATTTGYKATGNDAYQQFCEQYFKDLRLTVGAPDGMNRLSNQWAYKNKTVGTYAETPDYTVVIDEAQTAAKAIDNISKSYTDSGSIVSVNGGSKTTTAATSLKVGDVIEVYMSDTTANQVANITVTRYSVAKLNGDVATKGEGDDLEVRVPGVFAGYKSADDVSGYAGLTKNDVVYYYVDNAGVYYLAKADSFEGQLTGTKNTTPVKYVISGSDYVANGNITISGVTTGAVYNTTYAYYTDANGYLIYADEVEAAASDYVVLQQIVYVPGDGSIGGSARVEARVVKMDGTTEVVTIESITDGTTKYVDISTTDVDGTHDGGTDKYLVWNNSGVKLDATVNGYTSKAYFTYTINSDNEYALTKVNANATDKITVGSLTSAAINNGKVSITGTGSPNTVNVNNNTVFVVAKTSGDKTFAVYTGKDNVPDVAGAALTWVAKNGVATHVYVNTYSTSTVSGDTVFIMDANKVGFETVKDGNTTTYYNTYKAIVNGESTTVKVKAASNGNNSLDGGSASVAVGLFTPTYNTDGLITKLTTNSLGQRVQYGYKLSDGTLVVGTSTGYSYSNDALVFIMDEDGNVTEAVASDLTEDKNDSIYVVTTNATDAEVDYLFIVENDDSDVSLATMTATGGAGLTLDKDTVVQTVTAASGQTYTFAATANGVGATVTYDNNNDGTFGSGETGITAATQTTSAQTVVMKIKVATVDGTEQVYTINIVTPAAPAAP